MDACACPRCGHVEGMKRCYVCGRLLPADPEHFYRDRTHAGGIGSRCRECERARKKPRGRKRYQLTIAERLRYTRHAELVAIAQDALLAYGAYRKSAQELPGLEPIMRAMGERLQQAVAA